jgi:hypothetical protein
MRHFCRSLLFPLLALLLVHPGVTRTYAAQSQPGSHPESHKRSTPKHKKPKVRHTKTILKGRHGKHARRPA